MDIVALLADALMIGSSYLLGIATGIYYLKNKMESQAEQMLDGFYEE